MIVLTILKWIGIVLGCLLGGILALALLILICVLFIPVRYRVSVVKDKPGIENTTGGFWITYAMHAISIRKKPGDSEVIVKILGIRIGNKKAKKSKNIDEDIGFDEDVGEEKSRVDEDVGKIGAAEIAPEKADSSEEAVTGADTEHHDDEVSDVTENGSTDEGDAPENTGEDEKPSDTPEAEVEDESDSESDDDSDSVTEADEKPEKVPLTRKIKDVIDKIKAIPDKIRGIFSKIHFIFFKIHSIIDFVRDHAAIGAVKKLTKETVKMIRYVGPKKLKGHLEFGTGEPDWDGLLLGGMSLCKASYNKDVSIVPNFQEICLIADLELRGRIRAIYFVRMALRIWFDKDVHTLWKRYRRMKSKSAGRSS